MTRKFSGWHMAAIMIAFFGVIVSVNMLMASFAVSTFGGKVVENSYVAGQRFNGWLEQARAQEALGWSAVVARAEDGKIAVTLQGAPADARVTATASHPVGRAEDVELAFASVGDGRYLSERPLADGRWYLHLNVTAGADVMRRIEQVR